MEIFYAAGLNPYRIVGTSASTALSSSHLCSNLCPYVLNCLNIGLENKDSSLSGVVIANSCDAMRRLYDVWQHYVKTPFIYLLDLPKIATNDSKRYFRKCLSELITAIENHYKVEITEKALKDAIILCNETRQLLDQLCNLRKEDKLPLASPQVLSIVKESMKGCRNKFNEELSSLLAGFKDHNAVQSKELSSENKGHRILISGGYADEAGLIKIVEESGGRVVCEDLCTGIRYLQGQVEINDEPIAALAEYYLEKMPCARMVDSNRRLEYLLDIINGYSIKGVIYYSLKFCDTNIFEFPYLRKELRHRKIPLLFLESDGSLCGSGQVKTRVQAFLEML
ncbi:MAG: 2-hydroxyacyl-CoA dehydratase [Candidatus Omnitrophota bacterium]|nr:MAG: 2-hydroxyacyl-CoA dehydratase [Candidatus Omnitrophota bacterium]